MSNILKLKYIYKRNNIYYFLKRINGISFKKSFHSTNLNFCETIRDKIILNRLNKYEIKELPCKRSCLSQRGTKHYR